VPLGTRDAGFCRGGRIHVRRCKRDCAVRAPHKSVVCCGGGPLKHLLSRARSRYASAQRRHILDLLVRCLQHWAGPRTKFTLPSSPSRLSPFVVLLPNRPKLTNYTVRTNLSHATPPNPAPSHRPPHKTAPHPLLQTTAEATARDQQPIRINSLARCFAV
jgi:hypothetical protein